MRIMAKKRPGRPKGVQAPKSVLHIEVPPVLKELMEVLAVRNHRKLTGEVIVALEKHLAEAHLWPPPSESAE